MRIDQWDPEDETTARGCYQVHLAVNLADQPEEPPMSSGTFGLYLREGWQKIPGEVWVATEADGTVLGYCRMDLPDLENLDRAFGGPVVHPAARRRGIGSALLRRETERAAAHGRTVLQSEVLVGSAGEEFARAVGGVFTMEEIRRVQYLAKIPAGTVAALRETAARAAAGYSLVDWQGGVPERYRGALAHVLNAFEDAPQAPGVVAEFWTAERIFERIGSFVRAGFMRSYGVAAIEDATGEMAAFTGVLVDPEVPEWGFQQLTAVTRPHRGHRLGLLVKTAMLELLAQREPRLERIQTGNAAANDHMIAVNEQLGYEVVPPAWHFYDLPTDKADA